MRKLGLLIEGTCWMRKIPQAKNSHCLYDLQACEAVLNGLHKAKESDLLESSLEKKIAAYKMNLKTTEGHLYSSYLFKEPQ